jgi:hypothetical protein
MSELGIEAVGGKRPMPKLPSQKEVEGKLKCLWTICWNTDPDWTPSGEFTFRKRDPSDPVFRVRDFERGREDGVGGLDILGRYRRADSLVTIYIDSCRRAARRYNVDCGNLIEVVLVHELAHLMTHRGLDVDDLSSSFMEHTAQCATYAYLKQQDPEALEVFQHLSPHQPLIYRTWEPLKDLPEPKSEIISRPHQVRAVVRAFFREVQETLKPPDRSEIDQIIGYDK